MARIKKRIYGPALLPITVDTALFTATYPTEISQIWASNPSGSTRTLTLSIGNDAAGTRFLSAYSIAAGFQGPIAYPGIMLMPGEVLRGNMSVADVNLVVSGIVDQAVAT
jgi:hypothetical protein